MKRLTFILIIILSLYTARVGAQCVGVGPNETICLNTASSPLGGSLLNSATTAVWSADVTGGTFSNVNDLNATWTPPTGFTGTATLTLTATAGCLSTPDSKSLTINVLPIPSASISGTISVCQNSTSPDITFTNPQGLQETITYNINGANQTIISVAANSSTTVAVPTSSSGVFSYNLESAAYSTTPLCSITLSGTATVTVNPGIPNVPGAITGTTAVCPALTGQIYSINTVANATTYNWSVPAGWVITAGEGTTSVTVTSGLSGQNGNITVTAGNSCGTSAASSLAVTVNPGTPAVPGVITGTTAVCPGLTGQIYSINTVANATTYNWSVPAGWVITAGEGTTSVTVTSGSSGQNGNITVTAGNSCGTS
ncbi:MAG: hypothetical protein WA816_11665, partial [Bacteroidales bacterium]